MKLKLIKRRLSTGDLCKEETKNESNTLSRKAREKQSTESVIPSPISSPELQPRSRAQSLDNIGGKSFFKSPKFLRRKKDDSSISNANLVSSTYTGNFEPLYATLERKRRGELTDDYSESRVLKNELSKNNYVVEVQEQKILEDVKEEDLDALKEFLSEFVDINDNTITTDGCDNFTLPSPNLPNTPCTTPDQSLIKNGTNNLFSHNSLPEKTNIDNILIDKLLTLKKDKETLTDKLIENVSNTKMQTQNKPITDHSSDYGFNGIQITINDGEKLEDEFTYTSKGLSRTGSVDSLLNEMDVFITQSVSDEVERDFSVRDKTKIMEYTITGKISQNKDVYKNYIIEKNSYVQPLMINAIQNGATSSETYSTKTVETFQKEKIENKNPTCEKVDQALRACDKADQESKNLKKRIDPENTALDFSEISLVLKQCNKKKDFNAIKELNVTDNRFEILKDMLKKAHDENTIKKINEENITKKASNKNITNEETNSFEMTETLECYPSFKKTQKDEFEYFASKLSENIVKDFKLNLKSTSDKYSSISKNRIIKNDLPIYENQANLFMPEKEKKELSFKCDMESEEMKQNKLNNLLIGHGANSDGENDNNEGTDNDEVNKIKLEKKKNDNHAQNQTILKEKQVASCLFGSDKKKDENKTEMNISNKSPLNENSLNKNLFIQPDKSLFNNNLVSENLSQYNNENNIQKYSAQNVLQSSLTNKLHIDQNKLHSDQNVHKLNYSTPELEINELKYNLKVIESDLSVSELNINVLDLMCEPEKNTIDLIQNIIASDLNKPKSDLNVSESSTVMLDYVSESYLNVHEPNINFSKSNHNVPNSNLRFYKSDLNVSESNLNIQLQNTLVNKVAKLPTLAVEEVKQLENSSIVESTETSSAENATQLVTSLAKEATQLETSPVEEAIQQETSSNNAIIAQLETISIESVLQVKTSSLNQVNQSETSSVEEVIQSEISSVEDVTYILSVEDAAQLKTLSVEVKKLEISSAKEAEQFATSAIVEAIQLEASSTKEVLQLETLSIENISLLMVHLKRIFFLFSIIKTIEQLESSLVEEIAHLETSLVEKITQLETLSINKAIQLETSAAEEVTQLKTSAVKKRPQLKISPVQEVTQVVKVNQLQNSSVDNVSNLEALSNKEVKHLETSSVENVTYLETSSVQVISQKETLLLKNISGTENSNVIEIAYLETTPVDQLTSSPSETLSVEKVAHLETSSLEGVTQLETSSVDDSKQLENLSVENATQLETTLVEEFKNLETSSAKEVTQLEVSSIKIIEHLKTSPGKEITQLESSFAREVTQLKVSPVNEATQLETSFIEEFTQLETLLAEDATKLETPLVENQFSNFSSANPQTKEINTDVTEDENKPFMHNNIPENLKNQEHQVDTLTITNYSDTKNFGNNTDNIANSANNIITNPNDVEGSIDDRNNVAYLKNDISNNHTSSIMTTNSIITTTKKATTVTVGNKNKTVNISNINNIANETYHQQIELESSSVEVITQSETSLNEEVTQLEDSLVEEFKDLEISSAEEVTQLETSSIKKIPQLETSLVKEITQLESSPIKETAHLETSPCEEITQLESLPTKEITHLENSPVKEITQLESSFAEEVLQLKVSSVDEVPQLETSLAEEFTRLETLSVEEVIQLESSSAYDSTQLETLSAEDATQLETPLVEHQFSNFSLANLQTKEINTEITEDENKLCIHNNISENLENQKHQVDTLTIKNYSDTENFGNNTDNIATITNNIIINRNDVEGSINDNNSVAYLKNDTLNNHTSNIMKTNSIITTTKKATTVTVGNKNKTVNISNINNIANETYHKQIELESSLIEEVAQLESSLVEEVTYLEISSAEEVTQLEASSIKKIEHLETSPGEEVTQLKSSFAREVTQLKVSPVNEVTQLETSLAEGFAQLQSSSVEEVTHLKISSVKDSRQLETSSAEDATYLKTPLVEHQLVNSSDGSSINDNNSYFNLKDVDILNNHSNSIMTTNNIITTTKKITTVTVGNKSKTVTVSNNNNIANNNSDVIFHSKNISNNVESIANNRTDFNDVAATNSDVAATNSDFELTNSENCTTKHTNDILRNTNNSDINKTITTCKEDKNSRHNFNKILITENENISQTSYTESYTEPNCTEYITSDVNMYNTNICNINDISNNIDELTKNSKESSLTLKTMSIENYDQGEIFEEFNSNNNTNIFECKSQVLSRKEALLVQLLEKLAAQKLCNEVRTNENLLKNIENFKNTTNDPETKKKSFGMRSKTFDSSNKGIIQENILLKLQRSKKGLQPTFSSAKSFDYGSRYDDTPYESDNRPSESIFEDYESYELANQDKKEYEYVNEKAKKISDIAFVILKTCRENEELNESDDEIAIANQNNSECSSTNISNEKEKTINDIEDEIECFSVTLEESSIDFSKMLDLNVLAEETMEQNSYYGNGCMIEQNNYYENNCIAKQCEATPEKLDQEAEVNLAKNVEKRIQVSNKDIVHENISLPTYLSCDNAIDFSVLKTNVKKKRKSFAKAKSFCNTNEPPSEKDNHGVYKLSDYKIEEILQDKNKQKELRNEEINSGTQDEALGKSESSSHLDDDLNQMQNSVSQQNSTGQSCEDNNNLTNLSEEKTNKKKSLKFSRPSLDSILFSPGTTLQNQVLQSIQSDEKNHTKFSLSFDEEKKDASSDKIYEVTDKQSLNNLEKSNDKMRLWQDENIDFDMQIFSSTIEEDDMNCEFKDLKNDSFAVNETKKDSDLHENTAFYIAPVSNETSNLNAASDYEATTVSFVTSISKQPAITIDTMTESFVCSKNAATEQPSFKSKVTILPHHVKNKNITLLNTQQTISSTTSNFKNLPINTNPQPQESDFFINSKENIFKGTDKKLDKMVTDSLENNKTKSSAHHFKDGYDSNLSIQLKSVKGPQKVTVELKSSWRVINPNTHSIN